jgi:hypothetical protein
MKMTDIDEKMRKAVAAYAGPVTRCPAGLARAPAQIALVMNDAAEWLKQHRADKPTKDAKAERKRRKRARAQRERTARRNAAVRKRIGKEKQREAPQFKLNGEKECQGTDGSASRSASGWSCARPN